MFVEQPDFNRLMSILKRVDAHRRLDENDVVWLSTAGKQYFSQELRRAYHQLEAKYLANDFRTTGDLWAAINASSHYRKGECAADAHTLLSQISVEQQPSKIQASFFTTYGGVMRDLKRWNEGLSFGERAHALQPRDYRPCTLLGAIYMETGEYRLGTVWYDKAEQRGATVDDVDRDIRTILPRLIPERRAELKRYLLQRDPDRFAWVQRNKRSSSRRQ